MWPVYHNLDCNEFDTTIKIVRTIQIKLISMSHIDDFQTHSNQYHYSKHFSKLEFLASDDDWVSFAQDVLQVDIAQLIVPC